MAEQAMETRQMADTTLNSATVSRANSLAARGARRMIHGFTDLATMRARGPDLITGGSGIYVFDENGTPISRAPRACGAPRLASGNRN